MTRKVTKMYRPHLEALEDRFAPAQLTTNWTGMSSSLWSNAANWSNGVPNNGGGNTYIAKLMQGPHDPECDVASGYTIDKIITDSTFANHTLKVDAATASGVHGLLIKNDMTWNYGSMNIVSGGIVDTQGVFTWSLGNISGSGEFFVENELIATGGANTLGVEMFVGYDMNLTTYSATMRLSGLTGQITCTNFDSTTSHAQIHISQVSPSSCSTLDFAQASSCSTAGGFNVTSTSHAWIDDKGVVLRSAADSNNYVLKEALFIVEDATIGGVVKIDNTYTLEINNPSGPAEYSITAQGGPDGQSGPQSGRIYLMPDCTLKVDEGIYLNGAYSLLQAQSLANTSLVNTYLEGAGNKSLYCYGGTVCVGSSANATFVNLVIDNLPVQFLSGQLQFAVTNASSGRDYITLQNGSSYYGLSGMTLTITTIGNQPSGKTYDLIVTSSTINQSSQNFGTLDYQGMSYSEAFSLTGPNILELTC